MMKITLLVDGREMTFSEQELIAIVKSHFDTTTEIVQKSVEVSKDVKNREIELVATPTVGKCFEVNPLIIDRSLFTQTRNDKMQEKTRMIILEAFAVAYANPQKYLKPFKTFIPKKNWENPIFVGMIKAFAPYDYGGHMADWVEQSLEWAQRIANGETWEEMCNKPDTVNCFRLIIWKDGGVHYIGGTNSSCYSASFVDRVKLSDTNGTVDAVPLIVLNEYE